MKRDWDLIRHILNQAESCEAGYSIFVNNGALYEGKCYSLEIKDEKEFAKVCEHILLLGDSDLAVVRDMGKEAGVALDRLTMAGHDFLEAAKNETIWQKTMNIVKEKGGSVTLGVLTQILSAVAKQHFELS